MDSVPLGLLFAAVVIIIYVVIELGYKAGNTHPEHLKKEKEKITSHNSAAILGLLGFILVFTFGIVYSRYDSKKGLVREEANMIRTTWLRSEFLPEPDRKETETMLKRYVDIRIALAALKLEPGEIQEYLKESSYIQHKTWDIVVRLKNELDTHTGAMYIESLNEMFNIQALRIAVGIQSRIPTIIQTLLFTLVIFGMFSVGYQVSVAGSNRKSWLTPVMVLTFSLMITLIVALDRPNSSLLPVSQAPLIDLRAYMDESQKAPLP